MGNTPSVTGPDRGRLHVIRDDSDAGSVRGQRPEQSQIEETVAQLAEDYSDEEVNGRIDSLSVPESRDSYKHNKTFKTFVLCTVIPRSCDHGHYPFRREVVITVKNLLKASLILTQLRKFIFTEMHYNVQFSFCALQGHQVPPTTHATM